MSRIKNETFLRELCNLAPSVNLDLSLAVTLSSGLGLEVLSNPVFYFFFKGVDQEPTAEGFWAWPTWGLFAQQAAAVELAWSEN